MRSIASNVLHRAAGAGQAWVRPTDHADEADELGAVSIRGPVSEGLKVLRENPSRIVPGRLSRFMDAVVPAFVKRTFTAKMLAKALAAKSAAASARARA